MTEAEYETLNLNDMVEGFVQSRQFALDHLHLSVTKPDYPVLVRIAVDRIVQILDNLLTNAASFSPPEGHIDFAVDASKGKAIVTITDQGPGIRITSSKRFLIAFTRNDQVVKVLVSIPDLGYPSLSKLLKRMGDQWKHLM